MSLSICPNTPGVYLEIGVCNEMDKEPETSAFSTDSSLELNGSDVHQYWSVSSDISHSSEKEETSQNTNVFLPVSPVDDKDDEPLFAVIDEKAANSNPSPSLVEKYNSFSTRSILSEQNDFSRDTCSSPEGKSQVSFETEISSQFLNSTPPNEYSVFEDCTEPSPSRNQSVALSFGHSTDLDFLNNPSGSGSSNDVNRSSSSISLPKNLSLDFNVDNNLCFTNEMMASGSHKVAKFHLGEKNRKSLLTRWKTIEMYGEAVKNTHDISSNFQYAQYILKICLDMERLHELVKEKEGDSNSLTVDTLKTSLLNEVKIILKRLSVVGYPDAQYLLGDAYSSGIFGKIKNRRAFLLFLAAAKRLHIESIYRTAICYECGLGVSRNASKAVNFLTFAAIKNHPAAMYKLGVYSYHGLMGLPEDILTKMDGYRWLRRATSMANTLICGAPYELANIYMIGFKDLIISDPDYAMALYKKAAVLGHAESARLLAEARGHGGTVPRRHPESTQKYRKPSDEIAAFRKLI
ncbi:shc1p [Saccharomyces arboricola H-6]|uniref:Shc1p n=1 Tax=Saccharomyces arboricola (strain H-6 / AS 2.3317 / CBS 10644) TaxID=1160507 RepID=J8PPC2_SACAR|nr:shc1p [Saccharomyces arboricola H-6]